MLAAAEAATALRCCGCGVLQKQYFNKEDEKLLRVSCCQEGGEWFCPVEGGAARLAVNAGRLPPSSLTCLVVTRG